MHKGYGELNETQNDHNSIEDIESVLYIAARAMSNDHQNHFHGEEQGEYQVSPELDLREPIWLVEVLGRKNHSIQDNQRNDEPREVPVFY